MYPKPCGYIYIDIHIIYRDLYIEIERGMWGSQALLSSGRLVQKSHPARSAPLTISGVQLGKVGLLGGSWGLSLPYYRAILGIYRVI